jgi:hypothetical protein
MHKQDTQNFHTLFDHKFSSVQFWNKKFFLASLKASSNLFLGNKKSLFFGFQREKDIFKEEHIEPKRGHPMASEQGDQMSF